MATNPYAVRNERRRQLQDAYTEQLIQAYTQVAGGDRVVWVIDTYDGKRHELNSRDLPLALTMLRAGRAAPLDGAGETDGDDTRVPWREVPESLGIEPTTLQQHLSRGRFPAALIHDANPGRHGAYADAYVLRRELRHWGRAYGYLDPEGRPVLDHPRTAQLRSAA